MTSNIVLNKALDLFSVSVTVTELHAIQMHTYK